MVVDGLSEGTAPNVDNSHDHDQPPAVVFAGIGNEGVSNRKIGLRRVAPYWYPFSTRAKGRWFNREILEMVSSEFRDRSIDYYRFALESGVTTVNGKIAKPGTIIRNGDLLENIVHRHEPAVTSTPVEILIQDPDYIVINKPGSIPVHGAGRYLKQSLVHILKQHLGLDKVHTINRLDRLTSGLMIIPLRADLAHTLSEEFTEGKVRKEYIARCMGEFPEDGIICNQPMVTIDRQMGLNIVHPDGKPAQTKFKRIFYDPKSDTSVIHCSPLTGRSHQIRVHLQFLGHPIANDPIYSDKKIWGDKLGLGGLDHTPSDIRAPPIAPPIVLENVDKKVIPSEVDNLITSMAAESLSDSDADASSPPPPTLLPRETGHDIGLNSAVPLSAEAVDVIRKLRNMKDEEDDWGRWRDVIFRAKNAKLDLEAIRKQSHTIEGGDEDAAREAQLIATGLKPAPGRVEPDPDPSTWTTKTESGSIYCTECYLPLPPDYPPERLFIFLHAWKYTTSLGTFETKMPEWAAEDYYWEGMT